MTVKININNTNINVESPNGTTDAAFLDYLKTAYISNYLQIRALESKNFGSVVFPDGKTYIIKMKTQVIFEENN